MVAAIVIPMVIFTALPNIFFGYSSSDTDTVIRMTEQAMTIGGVYMSLEDFEAAQIDSVVTGIVTSRAKQTEQVRRVPAILFRWQPEARSLQKIHGGSHSAGYHR